MVQRNKKKTSSFGYADNISVVHHPMFPMKLHCILVVSNDT